MVENSCIDPLRFILSNKIDHPFRFYVRHNVNFFNTHTHTHTTTKERERIATNSNERREKEKEEEECIHCVYRRTDKQTDRLEEVLPSDH